MAELEKALILNPDCPEAYCGRGIVRFHLGDKDAAKEDLFRAFGIYEARGNVIDCMFTRSVIMQLFHDYEVHKDLFGIESKIAQNNK